MASEVLEFENLENFLLLKNGNYLYKIPFRDGYAVLKVYYGTRGALRYIAGTISNFFEGQSSFMPRARMLNEKRCLQIWREAGFRVFNTYDDVVVKGLPAGGYMLFEYLPALQFKDYFGDAAVSLEARLHTYRRFLEVWHRRHDLAVRQQEPRLVHENGDLKHVMIVDDQFLFFDFEMAYRSRQRVREFVAREILAYLKSLGKIVGPDLFPVFLKETIEHYEGTELLQHAYQVMFAHANHLIRLARYIDRKFSSRAAKPFSKYNVARKLKDMLDNRPDFDG
ncbi:MAG: hypothetical protein JRF72_00190 [Deltaproteobacteria bacterium]|jgi:hypothetical protein|nr:hypothetical protein [Deltaproteobacteria bacterium]